MYACFWHLYLSIHVPSITVFTFLFHRQIIYSLSCWGSWLSLTCSCSAPVLGRKTERNWSVWQAGNLLHHTCIFGTAYILALFGEFRMHPCVSIFQTLNSLIAFMKLMGPKHISSVRVKMMTTLRTGLKYKEDYPELCCQYGAQSMTYCYLLITKYHLAFETTAIWYHVLFCSCYWCWTLNCRKRETAVCISTGPGIALYGAWIHPVLGHFSVI